MVFPPYAEPVAEISACAEGDAVKMLLVTRLQEAAAATVSLLCRAGKLKTREVWGVEGKCTSTSTSMSTRQDEERGDESWRSVSEAFPSNNPVCWR